MTLYTKIANEMADTAELINRSAEMEDRVANARCWGMMEAFNTTMAFLGSDIHVDAVDGGEGIYFIDHIMDDSKHCKMLYARCEEGEK
jgi:hypothetical protein